MILHGHRLLGSLNLYSYFCIGSSTAVWQTVLGSYSILLLKLFFDAPTFWDCGYSKQDDPQRSYAMQGCLLFISIATILAWQPSSASIFSRVLVVALLC